MNTLHLVAPSHRGAVSAIPLFDYQTQPVSEIRAALIQAYEYRYGSSEDVQKEEIWISGAEGNPEVRALLYRPEKSKQPTPAILHIHGGGFIGGTADMMAGFCAELSKRHSVAVLSVDYRLAPETPFPGAHNDCYAALAWLFANAGHLGIDPACIAVLGDSAGGNIAAGVVLRNRDEKMLLLRGQLLIYPALDDRTGTELAPIDNPYTGEFVVSRKYIRDLWRVYRGQGDLDPHFLTYLAPALAMDLSGLPPTYIAVGSLDLFVEEDTDYALRLSRAGVSVELHVYDGAFHGFNLIPGDVTDRINTELDATIQRLLGATSNTVLVA